MAGRLSLHERLTEGEHILARGPRNHFPFEPAARCLFIAGGIGITPLLPMIDAAESAGARWQLLYGGRSRASMAFLDELERYAQAAAIRPADEYGLLDLDAFPWSAHPWNTGVLLRARTASVSCDRAMRAVGAGGRALRAVQPGRPRPEIPPTEPPSMWSLPDHA